jgi:hypothetical protein
MATKKAPFGGKQAPPFGKKGEKAKDDKPQAKKSTKTTKK